jgi:hypothetical protein
LIIFKKRLDSCFRRNDNVASFDCAQGRLATAKQIHVKYGKQKETPCSLDWWGETPPYHINKNNPHYKSFDFTRGRFCRNDKETNGNAVG